VWANQFVPRLMSGPPAVMQVLKQRVSRHMASQDSQGGNRRLNCNLLFGRLDHFPTPSSGSRGFYDFERMESEEIR